MSSPLRPLGAVPLLLLAAGCQPGASPGAAAAVQSATVQVHQGMAQVHQRIDWFHGSVEQALSGARRQRRPLMLFWGAQWCPFCHTLEATVFPRPDFIAKTRLFVPVYLDGDDPGAQRWGERFRVLGYPTIVLLDPEGHELLRLGAGRDVNEYAALLDVALAQVQPVQALLDKADAGSALSADECRRLAYNGWELDTLEPAQLNARAEQLAAAARTCPAGARLERARLLIYAAGYAADAAPSAEGVQSGPRATAALHGLLDQVTTLLTDPSLAAPSAPALANLDSHYFGAVQARGPQYASTVRRGYVAAMEAAASDPRFVTADQLGFIDAKIQALTGLAAAHAPLDAAVVQAADGRIDQALAREHDRYVRPGLINASLNILEDCGQYRRAYQLVKDEIGRSDSPYYYQADLAEVAEKLGRREEAIALLQQAYAGSRGPATRFQWGELYLSGLLRMAPHDAVRIRQVGVQVLGELDGPDRLADRARVSLERLDTQLRGWNRATQGRHVEVLSALRARMRAECAHLGTDAAAQLSCEHFLASA